MSTSAKNKIPTIADRKQHHIDVCKEGADSEVEGSLSSGFGAIQFIHDALPELSIDTVSTKCDFLGQTLSTPIFISCMTGGSPEGCQANLELAKAAQSCGVPLGLGSMRVVFDHPEKLSDFQMRRYAPGIPILANIGAVQVKNTAVSKLVELVNATESDALVVHLNCGQELFQQGGDRDFTGILDAIHKLVNNSEQIPIIVKETGFGIRPKLAAKLLDFGVAYIDVAGAGGTNWIMVEEGCRSSNDAVAAEFSDWGLPTATLLAALRPYKGKILASGGIRTGMDLAKSIALGASAGGMALPLIRAAVDGGADAVCEKIDLLTRVLRNVMCLTGSSTVDSFQQQSLLFHPTFEHQVERLTAIDEVV